MQCFKEVNEDLPEYLEAGSLNKDEVQGLQHVHCVGGCQSIAEGLQRIITA
jgi:hypothetical protein